jgi:hypothetical protein
MISIRCSTIIGQVHTHRTKTYTKAFRSCATVLACVVRPDSSCWQTNNIVYAVPQVWRECSFDISIFKNRTFKVEMRL